MEQGIGSKDRDILRGLAARQAELAHAPHNVQLAERWKNHNACRSGAPMVHIEVDTFAGEVIDPLLRCEGAAARQLEYELYHAFLNQQLFGDDKPVPPYFGVEWQTYFHPFGYEIATQTATDGQGRDIGHRFEHVLEDLEEDYEKLGPSVFGVKEEETRRYFSLAQDAFGDILPVKMHMGSLYAVPTQQVVHLMGMETLCFSLLDYPELVLQMMDRLAEDYLAFFRLLETGGYLLPTTGYARLHQGSFCFTDELPEKENLHSREVWGFLDSQETVSISPAMFAESIFPCYLKIAQQYGMLSYGCCEPVDTVWDSVRTLPGLRKVSISPWCNEEVMGEQLRGSKTIFHRKPNPNLLGVEKELDEDAVRAHIKATMQAARGCTLEITQRDVYTVHGNPAKVRRYVELIRECADRYWQ